jgi:TolB-like protein/tetratricopeptide (TPR) repeat protein
MVESDGRVVLTDFGLGMRPELIDRTLPRSSGTPIFMSPEVLAGSQATPQSDLYALGVTLLWALTGRPPFQARTLDQLKEEISRGPSSILESARRTSPRGLVHAIEWAIHPNPGTRPRSASDLAAHFLRALDRINLASERRRRTKAALLSLAVLGIAGIVFALIFHQVAPEHALRGPPSIAVLPLANLSGDPGQDFFSDGMTEELIARLAQVGNLQVISYLSVMPFKNSKQPLHEIARKLHVRMLVEGAVMRYGDRVRVSARLVDVRTGRGIWGEIYERDGRGVFALQSDIARAVVQGIEARLTPRERRRLDRAPLVNPEAHALYLHGLAAYREQTEPGVRRAIALYQRAVALDSNYVDPWVGLAYAYDYGSTVSVISRSEGKANARAAVHRALQLDPESGPARAILGTLQLWSDWNFMAAERSYREALALSPGSAEARAELVILLVTQGRFDEAISEAKRAREADPLSSMAATVSLFPLFEGRRYSEAIRAGREILITKPNFSPVMLVLGQALFYSGKRHEGIAMLERTAELDPTPAPIGWLGLTYGLAGNRRKAIEMRDRLNRMALEQWVDPYFFAIVDVGLGERARALDYIERAGYAHSPEAMFLRVDPALDPLRSEPRFQVLLKSLGMVG